jgi:DNA-binding transcriptional ArsR family regulator
VNFSPPQKFVGLERFTVEPNGSKKTLTINGADGQPIEIESGAYYLNPKARCHRVMREPLSSEANRVHACLELATMGFHQELAVKLDHGRKVPLTPRDIAQQTGLKLQNVSRGLTELEACGLAERRGKGDSRNSKFVIYSWALPRKPDAARIIARDYTEPSGLPPSWRPLIVLSKRLKINIDVESVLLNGSTLEEGEKLARDYTELESIITRFLKSNRAQVSHIRKKDRKDNKTKDTHTHKEAAIEATPVDSAPLPANGVRVPPPPPPQEPKAEPQSLPVPAPAPTASLKRCEEFISRYPDRGNAEDTRREYMRANTPATEEACHACLDRYLASDQVHRGILMRASRWLREQRGNNWAGDWQRPRTRTEIDERAADFARRMREERSRAGKR